VAGALSVGTSLARPLPAEVVMDSLQLWIVALALPGVLAFVLRGTRVFWLPGTVLLVGAGVLFFWAASIPASHEESVMNATAAGFGVIGAGISFVYGLLCLVLARRGRQRPMQPPAVPEAFVVGDIWPRD
jgi:hypothetical protein